MNLRKFFLINALLLSVNTSYGMGDSQTPDPSPSLYSRTARTLTHFFDTAASTARGLAPLANIAGNMLWCATDPTSYVLNNVADPMVKSIQTRGIRATAQSINVSGIALGIVDPVSGFTENAVRTVETITKCWGSLTPTQKGAAVAMLLLCTSNLVSAADGQMALPRNNTEISPIIDTSALSTHAQIPTIFTFPPELHEQVCLSQIFNSTYSDHCSFNLNTQNTFPNLCTWDIHCVQFSLDSSSLAKRTTTYLVTPAVPGLVTQLGELKDNGFFSVFNKAACESATNALDTLGVKAFNYLLTSHAAPSSICTGTWSNKDQISNTYISPKLEYLPKKMDGNVIQVCNLQQNSVDCTVQSFENPLRFLNFKALGWGWMPAYFFHNDTQQDRTSIENLCNIKSIGYLCDSLERESLAISNY